MLKGKYEYNANDIININESLKTNKGFTKKLLNETMKNPDTNELQQRFATKDISLLVQNVTPEQYQAIKDKFGADFDKLKAQDIVVHANFIDVMGKNDINEISITVKKDFLRKIIDVNYNLFGISEITKKNFPLLPASVEEYCSILPQIVRSIGIEANEISDDEISKFNVNMTNLADTLKNMPNNDFNELAITQNYAKDDFIMDVLEKIKDLPKDEQQKVFDYFGFELHENDKNKVTGYSITGYPVNLNNGKKLAKIDSTETKQVIESLRENVIRFSQNNKIASNNPQIEKLMNNIIDILPETRTMIGKTQHRTHSFDVMKHSLKVLQKIVQNPQFSSLSESDQKIIMLASILHDITKAEGKSDCTHPKEGSFDTFYIAKKFKLSKEEEIKLCSLVKNHEWLAFINNDEIDEPTRTKRMQSVAFDLQQSNLFDLSVIFANADIEAIKKVKTDKLQGWQESLKKYAPIVKEYVSELKKTQPLLPITKMPKTSTIEKAITTVNADGSTNIKGVYKDKNGLVVVKFNEVEDWEAIGFPKGSTTKGVMAKALGNSHGQTQESEVETGNIKFFVHGLDYANQLAKFDAFSLVDSDVLLSVSYAERPETKYRFFRPQGVILDVPSEYVYGGGNTDAGSGCGKFIDKFKENYTFGGHREDDRKYVSDLIKKATGFNDEEYVKFAEDNKNKPISELEPPEIREKIIKELATINSNYRKGERAYNEMYISNPQAIMGVFAYEMDTQEKILEPLKFLEKNDYRTGFLKDYALKNDVPFYVFGD